MFRTLLLAGAAVFAVPALAQHHAPMNDRGAPPSTTPGGAMPAQPATPPDPVTAPPSTTPSGAEPAQPATPPDPTAPPSSTPGGTDPGQPATTASDVAAIVGKEFGAYDKDGNGNLAQNEFGEWMKALKKASDPATDLNAPTVTSWIGESFAAADSDHSSSVSQAELVAFLTPRPG